MEVVECSRDGVEMRTGVGLFFFCAAFEQLRVCQRIGTLRLGRHVYGQEFVNREYWGLPLGVAPSWHLDPPAGSH